MVVIISCIAGGLLVGFLIGWLIQQVRLNSKLNELVIEKTQLQKDLEADAERMQWLELTQEKLKESFKALSADLLSSNASQFLNQAREKLSEVLELQKRDWGLQKEEFKGMVDPLGKNLEELDRQIQEMEQKREGAYQSLIQQVTQLGLSHQELQKTTLNLTQALKSSTVRGRWGEVQLRRIAEMA
ncbi:MAG: DNA recombination protein RmuC, partial [Calditrichaeota bacterium]